MTIRQAITKSGLTTNEIAQKLNISRQRVEAIINANDLKLSTIKKIADILNCNLADLLEDEINDHNRIFVASTTFVAGNIKYYIEIYKDSE